MGYVAEIGVSLIKAKLRCTFLIMYDDVKMAPQEIGFEGADWIDLAQYRDVTA